MISSDPLIGPHSQRRQETLRVLTAGDTVAQMPEEISEAIGHRLATVHELAILVDEVQPRIATRISARVAEKVLESRFGHGSRSR
jgi:cobalamin biosynthesis protein CbiD